MTEIEKALQFIEYAEGLKRELRHTWLSDDRRESSAEHSWRMAIMAIVLAPKTKLDLDLEKVLKLVLVHDIVEIEAKDVPIIERLGNTKTVAEISVKEDQAIENIRKMLGGNTGEEIYNLWHEFEDKKTKESVFANLLDKQEARIQKCQQPKKWLADREKDVEFVNELAVASNQLCNEDEFLLELNEVVNRKRLELLND